MIAFFKKIRLLINVFGFRISFLFFPLIIGFYKLILYLFYFFDLLFFHSKLKKNNIKKPIFLIGHPRSGTTFIHRYLLENTPSLKGNHLWQMIYSSVLLRKIISPFLPKMNKIFMKRNAYNKAIHETGLLQAETDDAAIMFRYFEGLLPFLYFDAWKKYESDEKLIEALKQNVGTIRHQKYLHRFYKRNLINVEKRLFSKLFSGILFVDDIIKNYPNCKIIFIVRNPEETIPSSLSLVKSMLSNFVDFDRVDDSKKKIFYDNIITISKYYYSELSKIVKNPDYNKQIITISYQDIKTEFSSVIKEIYTFCEIDFNDDIKIKIEQQSSKQKTHKSGHKYTLEDFGLDINSIQEISEIFQSLEF